MGEARDRGSAKPENKNILLHFQLKQLDSATVSVPLCLMFCPNAPEMLRHTVNTALLEERGLPVPASYEDMLNPAYAELISMPSPLSSGTGYSYYNGMITLLGPEAGLKYFVLGSMASGLLLYGASLTYGFAGTTAAITGAQNAISQQMNANEIASLNRSFAEQTANQQGFNGVQAGLSDVRYTVAQENCQDRYEAAQNTQNIITALTAGIQSIKDDLCQDRLDAERRENANLRSELMYARGQASQVDQTAQLRASQLAANTALLNELRVPVRL